MHRRSVRHTNAYILCLPCELWSLADVVINIIIIIIRCPELYIVTAGTRMGMFRKDPAECLL